MFLLTLDREVRPAPEPISVPPAAPAPPPKRNWRIRLFDTDKPDRAAHDAPVSHGTDQPAEHAESLASAQMVGPSDPSDESGPPELGVAPGDKDNPEPGVVGRIRVFFRGR